MTNAPLFTELAEAPSGGVAHFVTTSDDTKVRFALWADGTAGTVFLFPGRTEYIEKYGRMVGDLTKRGFAVVVIDWRGQGLSDHMDGRTDIGDVVNFADYQQDLATIMDHPDVLALTGPRLLFSHSMGGCIALRSLLNGVKFDAAVFSAPMWDLTIPHGAYNLMAFLTKIARALGMGNRRMPSTSPGFYVVEGKFDDNTLTTDQNHWEYMRDQVIAKPELGLGGASMRWFRNALDEFKAFRAEKMPDIPILVMLGSDEKIVSLSAVQTITKRIPNGKLLMIDNARHEIWMETPEIQAKAWAEIDTFLADLA